MDQLSAWTVEDSRSLRSRRGRRWRLGPRSEPGGGSSRTRRSRVERTAGRVCLAGSLLVAAFWTLYFGGLLGVGVEDPAVRAFEEAFPVADAAFGLLLLAAARSLLRGRPAGPFFLTAAGAVSVYLGLLDATFYGLRGLNHPSTLAGGVELALNLICLVGGGYALRTAWRLHGWGRPTARTVADESRRLRAVRSR